MSTTGKKMNEIRHRETKRFIADLKRVHEAL